MSRNSPIVLEAIASVVRSFRWLALLLAILFLVSGMTIVQPGEVVLILRLGKLQGQSAEEQIHQPGLLFALPSPIDELIRVPVKEEGEVVIQDLWKPLAGDAITTDTIDPLKEGYCLTGDQNILQARMIAKYRIDDPVAYALTADDPKRLVHDIVMTSATETIAGWRIDNALRLRDDRTQESLVQSVKSSAQTRLDSIRCGLALSAVEFKEIHPPRHVRAEFERAQSSRVQKDTRRREAEGFAAREIPQSEAERNRLIKEAMANRSNRLSHATAELVVFKALLAEYQRDPALTRQRLYRETLQTVMQQVGKRYLLPPKTRPGDVRLFISESEDAK